MTNTTKKRQLQSAANNFPWSFYYVDVLLLLQRLKPVISWATATELLVPTNKPIIEPTKACDQFLQKVATLTPELRRSVVIFHSSSFCLRGGRAFIAEDPVTLEGTMFRDDPLGWMRNALLCIPAKLLPIQLPNPVGGKFNFYECPEFAIELDAVDGDDSQRSIVPLLHHGNHHESHHDHVIAQSSRWMQDIRDGYDLAGLEVSKHWTEMVPGTSVPDPVYRFILDPTQRLRVEAQLFLRQIAAAREAGLHTNGNRPARFRHGPIFCSKRILNIAFGASPRGNAVSRRLWTSQNQKGTIWQEPDSRPKQHDHEYWFDDETTFRSIKEAVKNA